MTLAAFVPIIDELRSRGKAGATTILADLEVIVRRSRVIADAVATYEAGAAARVAVPYEEVVATVAGIEALLAIVTPDLDYPLALGGALRDVERALFDLGTLRRSFASQTTPTAGTTNVFDPGTAPFVPYRLRQGDTLERLARAYLGDVARAGEIVSLNALSYPYLETERDYRPSEFAPDTSATVEFDPGEFATTGGIDRFGVPAGVRVTGEVLWLPSDATVSPSLTLTDRDVELWGRDLKLAGGFLVVDDQGEADVVAGKDNIVQALGQRIMTSQGELLFHPTYGMETLLAVGIEGTRANVVLSGMVVARAVKDDPRVTHVRNLEVLFRETVNSADMIVGLIGASGATLPLNLVIPESVGAAAA